MSMFEVSVTIPNIEAKSPEQAARMFLAALMSADWSAGLSVMTVSAENIVRHVTLPVETVEAELRGFLP